MKLKNLKKSAIFDEFNKLLPRKELDKDLDDLSLFMEKKREIGTKSDK